MLQGFEEKNINHSEDPTLHLLKVWWRSKVIWPPYEDLKKTLRTNRRMGEQMDRRTDKQTTAKFI